MDGGRVYYHDEARLEVKGPYNKTLDRPNKVECNRLNQNQNYSNKRQITNRRGVKNIVLSSGTEVKGPYNKTLNRPNNGINRSDLIRTFAGCGCLKP